jgi:signal peptidase I
VWIRSTGKWFWRMSGMESYYRMGDVVGFSHPDTPQHVSCKRIVGVAGDEVNRYGQYIHLYVDQDPEHWGQMWPDENDPIYSWIDRSCAFDQNFCKRDRREESQRTIIVPDGHVWLEADCPALGIDSRQFGPVPLEWLHGKVVARLWPLWRKTPEPQFSHRKRPHPIPLDQESLHRYNVHVVPKAN